MHEFYFTLPYCVLDCEELRLAGEDALFNFQEEMSDDHLIINAIKSSEYKQYAFDRGEIDYSEIDRMRMTSTGMSFFPKQDRPPWPQGRNDNNLTGSDALFRSSLKGFYTAGKRTETEDEDTTTRASS